MESIDHPSSIKHGGTDGTAKPAPAESGFSAREELVVVADGNIQQSDRLLGG